MAAKKNKLSTKQESIAKSQNLIQFSPRNSKVLCHVSNMGKTKSWLQGTSRCNNNGQLRHPPLLYHLDDSSYNLPEYTLYFQQKVVDTFTQSILPSRDPKIPCKFDSLSSHYHVDPFVISHVQLSGIASPALMAYYMNPRKEGVWTGDQYTLIKYECNTIDPFDAKKKCMRFTSIVGLKDVYFALSLQGTLAVMQEFDSRLTITAISSSRGVPSVSSRYFKEYLVELNGEILLVFLIHQKSARVIDQVEVFRLCFPDLKWIKVAMLQGNTLFLDHERVSSTEVGSRRNCIYFTQGSDSDWWIYDMGSCCISSA